MSQTTAAGGPRLCSCWQGALIVLLLQRRPLRHGIPQTRHKPQIFLVSKVPFFSARVCVVIGECSGGFKSNRGVVAPSASPSIGRDYRNIRRVFRRVVYRHSVLRMHAATETHFAADQLVLCAVSRDAGSAEFLSCLPCPKGRWGPWSGCNLGAMLFARTWVWE